MYLTPTSTENAPHIADYRAPRFQVSPTGPERCNTDTTSPGVPHNQSAEINWTAQDTSSVQFLAHRLYSCTSARHFAAHGIENMFETGRLELQGGVMEKKKRWGWYNTQTSFITDLVHLRCWHPPASFRGQPQSLISEVPVQKNRLARKNRDQISRRLWSTIPHDHTHKTRKKSK